jgi:serine/threonine protein kinase
VAIKVIDVENAEDEVEDIIQEISILSELHSPYVTQYHGSYLKGSDLWIVMEFCSGGSCGDLMKPGLIGEDYISIIIRELLLGLDYLHGDKKLHRDIKGRFGPILRKEDFLILVCSCECIAGSQWASQARRLWCFWSTFCHNDEEKYFRWHALLDGPRGDQAVWV